MNSLNMSKVSAAMTPKERAKLVISLELKALGEITAEEMNEFLDGELFPKREISTQSEINMIVSSCPNSEATEYNFYIDLKRVVWHDIVERICNNLTRLDVLDGKVAALNYIISMAPLVQHSIDELERTPVVVSKKEYEEGVKQIIEHERSSAFHLEGRFNLAEEEAYHRLLNEGLIAASDDYLDGYLDFIDKYGKSEEELLSEVLEQVRKGVEQYKKEKQNLDGKEPFFSFHKKYVDLSEEELKVKIREDYSSHLIAPSEQEYNQWFKVVAEEKERLMEALKEGKLRSKDNGIEAGSYYDWPERRQRFAGEEGAKERTWHPLKESCMEIGYSEGKVTSGGQAKEGDWNQIVVATEFSESLGGFGSPEAVKKRTERVIELLKMSLPLEITEKNYQAKLVTLKISRPEYEEMITKYVSEVTKLIKKIIDYIDLIRLVEKQYFDGMSLFSPEPGKFNFSLQKAEDSIKDTVEYHNYRIQEVLKLFTQTAMGYWEFKLENSEQYLLSLEHEVDKEWVSRQLNHIEARARSRVNY